MRWLLALPALLLAAPLAAQNSGVPGRVESVILLDLIVDRGLECGLLRPWQGESLRAQTRQEAVRLDEEQRARVAREIEERRHAMTCDDGLLNSWTEAAAPNMDREYLPELLEGYRALALLPEPPLPFVEAAGREDFGDALARIDLKLSELEAEGARPGGSASWEALRARQTEAVAGLVAAIAGDTTGRVSPEEATQLVRDVATIVELWLEEPRDPLPASESAGFSPLTAHRGPHERPVRNARRYPPAGPSPGGLRMRR